ncbi:hypothetical protein COCNU_05G003060 [Cocos nucifera]|uniref:Uncharacterized protein n=1 Tax=Cocos nucifera TaxID=13894 RepID=A0A8K0I7S0_COCNU|nr:hypothetical protein COCNU_05G003060 [Cocos nucifera]
MAATLSSFSSSLSQGGGAAHRDSRGGATSAIMMVVPALLWWHLEKQSEVLMEAYRTMSHELHRLQVDLSVLEVLLGVKEKVMQKRMKVYHHRNLDKPANHTGAVSFLRLAVHKISQILPSPAALSTLIDIQSFPKHLVILATLPLLTSAFISQAHQFMHLTARTPPSNTPWLKRDKRKKHQQQQEGPVTLQLHMIPGSIVRN